MGLNYHRSRGRSAEVATVRAIPVRPQRDRRTISAIAWDLVGVIGGVAGVLFGFVALSFPDSPAIGMDLLLMGSGLVVAGAVLLGRP